MPPDTPPPGDGAGTLVLRPGGKVGPEPDPALEVLRRLWPSDDAGGLRLGRFEVLRELGRGGCGIVFLAFDPALGCRVALKVPRLEALLSGDGRRRLLNEARAAALLDHPNIVAVREVGEAGPLWYIAAGYCEGPTLAGWLAASPRPVSPRDAAALVATLADAVQHMHARGILHRDLKPGNILLAPASGGGAGTISLSRPEAGAKGVGAGTSPRPEAGANWVPKITDFGLAKLLDGDGASTRTGVVLGTPWYMAPEQAAGRSDDIGPATDVYALGVILYELLAGRPPFEGATPAEAARLIAAEEPKPLRSVRRDVPRDLEAICTKCLAKGPRQRYATARGLAEDLNRFLCSRPTAARPLTVPARAARWCRRHAGGLTSVAVCAALASGLAVAELSSPPSVVEVATPDPAAEAARSRAEREARERLYALAVGQARDCWRRGQTDLVRESLDKYRPAPGQDDLRGFAWYYLWDQGRALRVLRGAEKLPSVLEFSADGKRLVAATEGGSLYRWDAADGHLLPSATPGAPSSRGRAFMPAARRMAAIEWDDRGDTARVWDLDQGVCLARRQWPAGCRLWSLALAPDGNTVALTQGTPSLSSLILWDWARDEAHTLPLPKGEAAGALRFAPDSKTVALVCRRDGHQSAGEERWVELRDTSTGKTTARLTGLRSEVYALDWSADGKTLATGGARGEARLWDVPTAQERAALAGLRDYVHSLAFSPDGTTLAVGTAGSRGEEACGVSLYDAATGARRPEALPTGTGVHGLAFAPDGATLAVGCGDNLVRLWQPARARPFQSLPGHSPLEAWSVAFPGQDHGLASAGDDSTIRLWDLNTGRARRMLLGHYSLVSCLAFSPRSRLLASGGYDRTVRLWDPATGRQLARLTGHAQDIRCLAFSPDGRLLASGSGTFDAKGGELKLWDVEARRERASLAGHADKVRAVAFAPSGQVLCSAGEDGTVRVWDVETGELRRTLPHPGAVWSLAFSPHGRALVSGDKTGAVRFWNIETGEEVLVAYNHGKGVRAVAFSPDGKTLATGGLDRTVRLWQAANGQELLSFPDQPHDVNSLAFSPDGTALAAALHDGSLRIWRAPRTDD
jgi:WD40 repeat protein/serine/threonine protein kinase